MKSLIDACATALVLLTRIPVPFQITGSAQSLRYSLLFYPLIGWLLASAILLSLNLTQDLGTWLSAVLALIVWVVLTGGIHLDGFADTFDAWVGSHGDAAKARRIMKDPNCGAMGVIALVLLLMLKLLLLQRVIQQQQENLIILALVSARMVPALLIQTCQYINRGGLATQLHWPHRTPILWCVYALLLIPLLIFQSQLILVCAGLAIVFLLLRGVMLRWLGGYTGDCIGAMVEFIEVFALFFGLLFF